MGQGEAAPRLKGDYWIIDVPHLIARFDEAFARFCSNPAGPLQKKFALRLRQQLFYETQHGVTTSLDEYYRGHGAFTSAPLSGSNVPTPLNEFGFIDPG